MTALLYLLFFFSGMSGLIYQVAWVREFGNVFGNSVYSASLVLAVFMLGLGVGSLIAGRWADRHHHHTSLVRTYGQVELAIGGIGLAVSALLPHLDAVSALASSYSRLPNGWWAPSAVSYAARLSIATALLAPITLLMGGTLTLLIRHVVQHDLGAGGRRLARLYAINTAGAAAGAILADFALASTVGWQSAQWIAAFCNLALGACALVLSRARPSLPAVIDRQQPKTRRAANAARPSGHDLGAERHHELTWASAALALSGFAAMGIEIVWFRHFTLLLGPFRAVFSLLLAVILISLGAGAWLAGNLPRPLRSRPAETLMIVEGLFVALTLFGLSTADVQDILADGASLASAAQPTGWPRALTEVWLNAKVIAGEVALPSMLMGFAFPLANAMIQHTESSVARRAGVLYLANTIGGVCGSLVAGFLLLPILGMQTAATVLGGAAAAAVVPLYLTRRTGRSALAISLTIATVALAAWAGAPANAIVTRAQVPLAEGQQRLALSEGPGEVVVVLDSPDEGRQLLTNGHPMSSTSFMSQRYMRALAHIPLLSMERPERVLVIGFGVGNTAHAVSLHPSIRDIEVADLSRHVLQHAGFFRQANHDVLDDPRVSVYVDDGRQHLRGGGRFYDLVTLEPPPPAFGGVGALYSKDFYAIARTRLEPNGYISQWLPAYQVSQATTLAMIRAFIEVFPQSVLLSGAAQELLLIGVNGPRIEIDPRQIAARLRDAPAVEADLRRLSLDTPRDIVGTFLASPRALADATRAASPVTDDHPVQEYDTRSRLVAGDGNGTVPPSLYAVNEVRAWCPACFAGSDSMSVVPGLDTYLAMLNRMYLAVPADNEGPGSVRDPRILPLIQTSTYLRALVPNAHTLVGVSLARQGRLDEAVVELRAEVVSFPGSAVAHWNLGDALVARGDVDEGVAHLRRSVQIDPANPRVQFALGAALLMMRAFAEAADHFGLAIRAEPTWVDAHNERGIALASLGNLDEAIREFQLALSLQPDFTSAHVNLTRARQELHHR